MLAAGGQHRVLNVGPGSSWARVRGAGAVLQAGVALDVEPGHPAMRALARDAHRLGCMRHRPALTADPIDQQTATMNIETGVSVGHENLRAVGTSTIHTSPGGSPRRQHLRVTNVPAEYT